MMLAAAQGDADQARALLDALLADYGEEADWPGFHAMIGDRENANRTAAGIDAEPLGFLMLADLASNCSCGAPFDLEATPNFARLVEEADLMWPPRSPVEWPLKGW